MPKFKIKLSSVILFQILVYAFLFQQVANTCPYPYQRCICSGGSPFCPCQHLTSSQTVNMTSSYISHLVLVSGYGCRPCPSRCKKCNSLQVCTECFDQYELIGSLCQPCPINCKKCRIGVCQQCIESYYIDYQRKCQKCPLEGTKACTIDSLRSCQTNYWLDNNGAQCISCDINCRTCSSTTKCTKCLEGFFQNSFQCGACKSECKSCQNIFSCLQCVNSGYYFNLTQGVCVKCPADNCMSCGNNGVCTICDASNQYFLDKNSSQCLIITSINSSLTSFSIENCRSLINFTVNSSSDLRCQLCNDGYYLLNDYENTSAMSCFYGCSVLCKKCSGPHYGLCDQCIDSLNYELINRNCIPRFNLNGGAQFQLFYTSFNNNTFFQASSLILPNSCWHQYVKGGGNLITIRISNLASYKIALRWKVYKYAFNSSSYTSDNQTYEIQLSNSILLAQNQTLGFSFLSQSCQQRTPFSILCTNALQQCIDKNSAVFQNVISSGQNILKLTSSNSMIAISQLLLIAYRCGGIYGDGCAQCSNINTCTKCSNPSSYLIAERCVSDCPNTHYKYEQKKACFEVCPLCSYSDDSLHECFSCVSPCETCNSEAWCVTCRQGFFYNQITANCQITCPDRYFEDGFRRICQKCSNPCLNCQNSMSCSSCRYGYMQVLNQTSGIGICILQCKDEFYASLTTFKCQQCEFPCKKCSYFADQCVSCSNQHFLYQSQCLNQCPIGYYQNQTSLECQQCHPSCQSCENETYCLQCSLGFYLTANNICSTECNQLYYQKQITQTCSSCSPTCKICKSSKICSSCVEGYLFYEQNYECIKICPVFFYENKEKNQNYLCSRCQLPCYQCSSRQVCLSCYDSFLYYGLCSLSCPFGYFTNITSLQCQQCDLKVCLQCKNSPIQCTKCGANYLLVQSKCLAKCPEGFYFSEYKNQCLLCEGLCDTCLNSTFCSKCISRFILSTDSGTCTNDCSNGFYKQKGIIDETYSCIKCPQNCQLCEYNQSMIYETTLNINLPVKCLSCIAGFYFLPNFCYQSCPDGYFNSYKECLKCTAPCSKCSDEDYCIECMKGYGFLYQGTCLNDCPFGLFSLQNECQKCFNNCLLCSQQSDQCSACSNNFSLLVLADFALTKNDSSVNTSKTILQSCQSECPDQYYNSSSSQVCQRCSSICRTCQTYSQSCVSCKNNFFLYNRTCLQICPIGYYAGENNQGCLKCSQNCASCLNNSFCLKCQQTKFLNNINLCEKTCMPDQYSFEEVCRKCGYPCLTCIDQFECLSCITGIFYQNDCIQQCPDRSFYQKTIQNELCITCAQNCSKCLGLKECQFCQHGNLFDGICIQKCPNRFFQNYGICFSCQQNCLICNNSYSCIKCITEVALFQQKCLNNCPIGYVKYVNASILQLFGSGMCLACQSGCIKCTKQYNKCTECAINKFLFIDSCLQNCPSGTYSDKTTGICQPCVSPCETCSNAYSCQSCIYSYLLYRQSQKNQCVQGPDCPNNYYLNVQNNVCEFMCPDQLYVSNSKKTCSKKCPENQVSYHLNNSCLAVCPDQMWVDEQKSCQINQTKPQNLPYLKCKSIIARNLLFFSCWANKALESIQQLNVDDFLLDQGEIVQIKHQRNQGFYLLVSNMPRQLKSEHLTLELVPKYQLVQLSQKPLSSSSQDFFQLSQPSAQPSQPSAQPSQPSAQPSQPSAQSSYGLAFLNSSSRYQTAQADNSQQQNTDSHQQDIINSENLTDSVFKEIDKLRQVGEQIKKQYPVQNYKMEVYIEKYLFYSLQQREVGLNFYRIGQSISYGSIVVWMFSLIKNTKATSLLFIINLQWLFSLSLLSEYGSFPPNFSQFIESFKFSIFFFFNNQQSLGHQNNLWSLESLEKDQYWAINQYYDIDSCLRATYILVGAFTFVYLFTFISQKIISRKVTKEAESNKQTLEKSQIKIEKQVQNQPADQAQLVKQSQQANYKCSLLLLKNYSKKCQIIKDRFQFNYTYHLLLITANGISIVTSMQFIKPNSNSIIQIFILIGIYLVFLSTSFIFYLQSRSDRIKYKARKPLRSTAFFFVSFLQILIQNTVIIWTNFYFYVGFGMVIIILKVIIWSWIYQIMQPSRCLNLQIIQLCKIITLTILVIGQMKLEKWSVDQMYYFGFVEVGIVFILIIVCSISIAQQLFAVQSSYKQKKRKKTIIPSRSLNQISLIDQQKQIPSRESIQTSGFQDDDQNADEQSFFTNRTPLTHSDQQSSEGDIIDFDESAETSQNKLSEVENNKKSRPPKQLFKYNKTNQFNQ